MPEEILETPQPTESKPTRIPQNITTTTIWLTNSLAVRPTFMLLETL